MKPTQLAELFANIKKTFVSFFSILMFVALGVGVFLGISWAGPALENAAESEFDKGAFHHFQLQYLYGLTDEDLAKLRDVEGVSDIEPGFLSLQTVTTPPGIADQSVKVQTIGERFDTLTVLEGELPAKPGEIALNAKGARTLGYKVGDTITFAKDDTGDDPLSALSSAEPQTAESKDAQAGQEENAAKADKDGMKYLNGPTYTVTALVESPEYLSEDSATYGFSNTPSGGIDMVGWVAAEAFDSAAFRDGYPIINIACDELQGLKTYGPEYKEKSSALEQRIEETSAPLAEGRFTSLYSQAKEKIDEADKKLAEGKQKVADGEKQLADGKAELETKKSEGEKKLADGYQQLMYYEGLRADGEAKLADGRRRVSEGEQLLATADAAKAEVASIAADYEARGNAAKAKYEASKKTEKDKAAYDAELDKLGAEATATIQKRADQIDVTIPAINHENYFELLAITNEALANYEQTTIIYEGETMTIAQARTKLAKAREELAAGEAEYNQRVAQIQAGWAEYYAGQAELERLVAEGEQKIADGEKQLAEAKQQVAENEPKLNAAKEAFADMKDTKCAVISRTYNAGAAEISTFSGVTNRLSISMAALFIIVGLLVSYSAVSRIVHEQVTQIGTKKALGLRSREITVSFLAYSGIAVITGAIVGTIVGVTVVEGIIGHALGGMFIFGDYPPHFDALMFLGITLLELALVLGATWLACRSILKEHAVELLKGEKPPTGKTRFYEKWGIWDKLPLFTQTIVNNCVNDKRRVFSTVVGVAGCTALIVTAVTLNNDVMKSYDAHYSDVYGFNAIAYVDSSNENAAANTAETLVENGATASTVCAESFILVQPDGNRGTMRIIVPSDASGFEDIYHLNSVQGDAFDASAEGVWVSQAYQEHFGAKVGDKLKIEATDGTTYELPILGFNEFWLTYNEAVMGRGYYESTFGKDLKPSSVLADTHGAAVDEFVAPLSEVDGFDSIKDDKTYQHGNFETFSSVSSAVVLIYMALAILMAVVVLLNLNVMFIDEKKRELIVLMINGFSVKAAKKYVYNDTIVLTIIGIALGVVLGCIMGSITVGSIEPITASFVKGVDLIAVLAGIVVSALLAFIMSAIALRRIPRFELTDINRF